MTSDNPPIIFLEDRSGGRKKKIGFRARNVGSEQTKMCCAPESPQPGSLADKIRHLTHVCRGQVGI
jgi:hypothetical protein